MYYILNPDWTRVSHFVNSHLVNFPLPPVPTLSIPIWSMLTKSTPFLYVTQDSLSSQLYPHVPKGGDAGLPHSGKCLERRPSKHVSWATKAIPDSHSVQHCRLPPNWKWRHLGSFQRKRSKLTSEISQWAICLLFKTSGQGMAGSVFEVKQWSIHFPCGLSRAGKKTSQHPASRWFDT